MAQGRIQGADPATTLPVPADADRIALPGKTPIPGIIGLHSHLLPHPYDETTWDDQVLQETLAYRVALAARHVADARRPASPRCAAWARKARATPTRHPARH